MLFKKNIASDKGWRGANPFWKLTHVLGIVAPALVFWLAPENVLTKYPILQNNTAYLKEWIPAVRNVSRFSEFPQVAELGMSMIFICCFLLIIVFRIGKTTTRSRRIGYTFPTEEKEKQLVYISSFIIIPIVIIAFFNIGPADQMEAEKLLTNASRLSRMVNGVYLDNRIAAGLMASLTAFGVAFVVAVIEIQSIKHLVEGITRRFK